MKKIVIVLVLLSSFYAATAQEKESRKNEKEKKGGFKKENLFVGGDLTLAFSNLYTVLGISPYFGYSVNKYLDVAVSGNVNYTSQRDNIEYGDKARQTVYGPGALVRIYPIRFLFAQAQYEHNFIRVKYFPAANSNLVQTTTKVDANSLLLGAGFAGGRSEDNKSFYYISVAWDVLGNENSPYVDGLKRSIPIFRIGYNIALFQGRR